jgi:hypothetical protein
MKVGSKVKVFGVEGVVVRVEKEGGRVVGVTVLFGNGEDEVFDVEDVTLL